MSPPRWRLPEPPEPPITGSTTTGTGAASGATTLPVADPPAVRRHVGVLLRRHRRGFVALVLLNAVAALAALVGPRVLGGLVQGITDARLDRRDVTVVAVVFGVALVVQTLFTRLARLSGAVLGESILADLREGFLRRVVALPPGVVERAGTGDLVTRTTTDIDRLAFAVQRAVPELVIAVVTAVLVAGALVLTAPLMALAWLLALPPILLVSRWYFRRAPAGYRSEMATYAAVNAGIAESVDAGRTIESLRLGDDRVARTDAAIRRWTSWEWYTLGLRTVFFPGVEAGYVLPLAGSIALGGVLVADGRLTLAAATTAILYTQLLIEPVDLVIMWYDELQVGQASLARLLGVHEVPDPDTDPNLEPADPEIVAREVRFGYRPDRDVLHGIDLDVLPGTRLAVVGPSGAGKSTLGRLIAGLHAPRSGTLEMGGAELARMPAERVRRHVVLVTQEHHVFVGTVRDNLLLARPEASDEDLWAALHAVGADEWVRSLPDRLDAAVGAAGARLSAAQAQQVALARLVLADPHTLVLDEATSLLDPRAARDLERSLGAVLAGRTVVAIAHRLHTAHDAEQVAVVEDGRITEYGSHDDLVAAGGAYAALWRSWRADGGGE